MPLPTTTGIARLLSSLPVPDAPYGKFVDPLVEQYVRRLHTYLMDLVSRFAVAQQGGFTLPPIPDPTKDYVLAYDAGDGTIKWIETTESCP